jgi:hypothetical protein
LEEAVRKEQQEEREVREQVSSGVTA